MDNEKIIALVDDDADFTASNKEMLEAFGYHVITAANGEEAMRVIPLETPDLTILDIMMTYDTEGIDVARKLRMIPELKDMKIMIVSGIATEKSLQRPLEPDANWLPVERVLEKPISPPVLLAEIERLLAHKHR